MKQLCKMNDTVTHPNAIPRTLNVVASMSNARNTSGRNRYGVCEEARIPTFTENDCTRSCPSLIGGEETEGIIGKITHSKKLIYSVNTCHHKPGMSVDIF